MASVYASLPIYDKYEIKQKFYDNAPENSNSGRNNINTVIDFELS